MKRVKLGLLIITFLLLNSDISFACTCAGPQPVAQSLAQATAVFSGKVVEIKRVKRESKPGREIDWLNVEVVFAVNTVWKGIDHRVISVFTSSQSTACGYGFKDGRTYLVYAHGETQENLSTSICTRTKRLKDARGELKELGAGKSMHRS